MQEALNALKYAGSHDVCLRYEADCLDLGVQDGGRQTANQADRAERGGCGLIGTRERVALYGGTLVVDARLEGGFAVHARIPLERGPA